MCYHIIKKYWCSIMKILICDDEILFLKKLKEFILIYQKQQNIDIELITCLNGQEVLDFIDNSYIDVAFLDIDMPYIDGFELAKTIKSKYEQCIVVFCTSHNELVYDSFKYEPFWFLCKSNYKDNIYIVLEKIINKFKCYNKEIIIKNRENIFKIRYKDIIYIEVKNHKIKVHTINETLEYRENLYNIEKDFFMMDFVKVNSGCIVNLEWIIRIKDNELILKNNENLIISRSNKKNVKNAFYNYLERI